MAKNVPKIANVGKIFLSWILIGWLAITLFQMLNFHKSLPFSNWIFTPHSPKKTNTQLKTTWP